MSVQLLFCGMLLLGFVQYGLIAFDKVLFMGQIELFDI